MAGWTPTDPFASPHKITSKVTYKDGQVVSVTSTVYVISQPVVTSVSKMKHLPPELTQGLGKVVVMVAGQHR